MRQPSGGRVRIIVTGLIAQHPRVGGMAWHYGQYAAGLSRMGHDVYYFEDSGEWPYTEDGSATGDDWVARDCSCNLEHLNRVMARWGLENRWAYRFPLNGEWFGLSESKRKSVVESADLLINVSGTLERPEHYRDVKCLIYVDSDPVFTQSRILNGTHGLGQRVAAHDIHFSFGERVADTGLNTAFDWRPTRQPVLLSDWNPEARRRSSFSTVMNWTSYSPAVVRGRSYGQKDREFAKFIGVAKEAPTGIDIALGRTQHSEWENAALPVPDAERKAQKHPTPHALLTAWGWRVLESSECCGTPDSYRQFIESSRGEWSIAKEAYAALRPGWFSERSACYLAAGRPVVVQDTGFSVAIPTGEGLFAFRTPPEAVTALQEVEAAYSRHCEAARGLAETFFDSSRVLGTLLDEVGDARG